MAYTGKFKVGDGTRVWNTQPSPIQNVRASVSNNVITVAWDALANAPAGYDNRPFYQIQYCHANMFNESTLFCLGPNSPSLTSNYYSSANFANASPDITPLSATSHRKYVLMEPTTSTSMAIPIKSGQDNVSLGIPLDTAKNFYFRVRASWGDPVVTNVSGVNNAISAYQKVYPADAVPAVDTYGNWGDFSVVSVASTLTDVIWIPDQVLIVKLRTNQSGQLTPEQYFDNADTEIVSSGLPNGYVSDNMEYQYTHYQRVKLEVQQSTQIQSLQIISTDPADAIYKILVVPSNLDDPANVYDPNHKYDKNPSSSDNNGFDISDLYLNIPSGTKSITVRGYQYPSTETDQGRYVESVASTMLDLEKPDVSGLPVDPLNPSGKLIPIKVVVGEEEIITNVVTDASSRVILNFGTYVVDTASGLFLVKVSGLRNNTTKYYAWAPEIDITNDLNLSNNSVLNLGVMIYDKAKNVSSVVTKAKVIVAVGMPAPLPTLYSEQVYAIYDDTIPI